MPVVFRSGAFRFFFYSNEGHPREPAHVHVEQGGDEAKFWIHLDVSVAYNDGFNAKTLRELMELVEENREQIEKAWSDFFS